MFPRKQYLEKLIKKKDNGRVKVITGLRRCGKSVLLFKLYKDYLLSEGVAQEQIIGLALDVLANAKYRNPMELDKYIRDQITDSSKRPLGTIFLIVTISFILVNLMPGDPLINIMGDDEYYKVKSSDPELLEQIAEKYGLNGSLGER